MTRLMCSTDRKEIEELKSRLFRAGIPCEVCSNPVAHALGILRVEVHIHDADVMEASRIHQEFLAARSGGRELTEEEPSRGHRGAGRKAVEVIVAAPAARRQLGPPEAPHPMPTGAAAGSGTDLAQAAVLLEKEIEEVLARDARLAERCAALQDQVKTLEQSLGQVRAELTRASSDCSTAERKLAETSVVRGSLEKELERLNLRLRAAEQSLEAAEGRLESQSRELKQQQAKAGELSKEVVSRDNQLRSLGDSLAQTRAALETEQGLRQATEERLGGHAAARESLEKQVEQLTTAQAQLQEQNQREREQMQACLDAVNKLCVRLNQKRTVTEEG